MDKRYVVFLFVVLPIFARAESNDLEKILRSGTETVKITSTEKKTLEELEKITSQAAVPSVAADGSVVFVYGVGLPTLLCKFFSTCEIVLENGEFIEKSNIEQIDPRIKIKPILSQTSGESRSILIVKPVIDGVSTNLHLFTNKRNYIIQIKSTKRESYPRISFSFSDPVSTEIKNYESDVTKLKIAEEYEYKPAYDGQYKISGEAEWQPIRAFFNGKKTIVEFKKDFSLEERPTFHRRVGDKKELVDYRVKNNKYVVDYRLDEGVLSLDEKEVIITHKSFKAPTALIKSTNIFISDEY